MVVRVPLWLSPVFCEVPLSSLVCVLFGRNSWEGAAIIEGDWVLAGGPGFTLPREVSLFQFVCPAEAPRGCPASEEGGGVSPGNPTHTCRGVASLGAVP